MSFISNQNELVLKKYLHKVAIETEDIICNDAKKAQFLKSIEAYRGMREKFLQTLQQYKDEAVKNELLYDEKATELPISKEEWETWEVEDDYLVEIPTEGETVNKKFWRPPLPFNPDAWIMRYYGSPQYNGIVPTPSVPKKPKEPDDAENLICEYVVLAVIHDESRNRPSSQKLTTDDDEWVIRLWNSIRWLKAIDGDYFEDRKSNINQAIKSVETDLKTSGDNDDVIIDQDIGKKKQLDMSLMTPESRVLAVYADNPDLNMTEIATKAGVNRSSLYRMGKFLKVKKMREEEEATSYKDAKPTGEKDGKTGKIEAWEK